MNMKNLKSKLSSRKFWALVSALVISILALFNCPQESVVQITSLITALGAVVAYILGESAIDKERAKKDGKNE